MFKFGEDGENEIPVKEVAVEFHAISYEDQADFLEEVADQAPANFKRQAEQIAGHVRSGSREDVRDFLLTLVAALHNEI